MKIAEVNPQEHDREERLDGANDRHDLALPIVGAPEDEKRQHVVPEHPKQESAFLTAPKRAQDEAHGHGVVEVFPDVLEFVAMAKEQHEHQGNHPGRAQDVNEKGLASRGDISLEKERRGQQGRGKPRGYQSPASVGQTDPFTHVLHHASGSSKWFCSLYFEGHFMSMSVALKCSPSARP